MASTIRIKRSSVSGNPSTLAAGELAYSALQDNGSNGGDRLYIGIGTETSGNATNHFVIGGKYFTDMLDHTPGTLTALSALLVDSDKKLDNLKVDNLDLNGNTISSTDTNGNIILDPVGSGYVQIAGTNALVIPVGTSAQQSPFVNGAIRLNSDTGQFEGYSSGNWSSLGGVRSVDGLTYISAELNPSASDDTLRFVTNDVLNMSLNTSALSIGTAIVTTFNNVTQSTSTSTGSVIISGGVGIAKNLYVGGDIVVTGNQVQSGNFTINGGDLYSTATTFNLLNKDSSESIINDGPATVNAFLGATAVNIGGATGTTTINHSAIIGSNLTINGELTANTSSTLKGNTTIGQIGTRVDATVYGAAVNITGSANSVFGIDANNASTITQIIQATNSIGNANLDVNVDDDFTLDATTFSIDATDTSNVSMIANSSASKTLLIDAQNAGTGAAILQIGTSSTDNTNIQASNQVTLTSTEVQLDVTTLDLNAQYVDITTVGSGNNVTVTSLASIINSDTLTLRGTQGSGTDTIVNVTGQLNVDNVRIDGNIISTTDNSNILYLDPAPTNDNGGLVIIKGDLQVDGTTTTVNSTQITIDDPIMTLGGDTTPTVDDNLDRGIEYKWHDGTNAKTGFFGWSDLNSEFQFIADATNTSSVFTPAVSGIFGNARFGKLAIADSTQSTTTTSGALTVVGGVGISGQLNVAGATNKFTATTASSSTTTGALVIAGGVGINGTIYLGTDLIGAGPASSNIDGFNIDGGTY